MSAEVESMFYVRKAPWHGLGTRVEGTLTSQEALIAAGLNWSVMQRELYTKDGDCVKGYVANVRDSDNRVLGVVTGRYQIVQNREAFAFTDELVGNCVTWRWKIRRSCFLHRLTQWLQLYKKCLLGK